MDSKPVCEPIVDYGHSQGQYIAYSIPFFESNGSSPLEVGPQRTPVTFTNSPVWVNTPHGPAVSCDGTNEINIAFGSIVPPYTLEGLFVLNNSNGYGSVITQGGTKGWYTRLITTDLYMAFFDGGDQVSNTIITAGALVHVHLTVNADASSCIHYLNGIADGSFASTVAKMTMAPDSVGGHGGEYSISDFIMLNVYNRDFSSTEIMERYIAKFSIFQDLYLNPALLPVTGSAGPIGGAYNIYSRQI